MQRNVELNVCSRHGETGVHGVHLLISNCTAARRRSEFVTLTNRLTKAYY